MKKSNHNSLLVSGLWKKALYSSVVLGALFVGGQYVGSINAHADDTTDLYFHDENNQQVDANIQCEIGKPVDLRNEIIRLQDEGYDTTGVPSSYTPNSGSNIINIKSVNSNIPSDETKQYKLQVRILDQNGNYIETKNYQSDDNAAWSLQLNDILNDIKNSGFKLRQADYAGGIDQAISDATANKTGTNHWSVNVYVIRPEHIVNVNYIDGNGNTVGTLQHAVTNYGHTNISGDFSGNLNGYEPADSSIINNASTDSDITVKQGYMENTSSNTLNGNFVETTTPSVQENSLYSDDANPLHSYYHTSVTVEDNNGNTIGKYIVSDDFDNIVDTSYFLNKYGNDIRDDINHTHGPNYIDLTKGPYIFKTSYSSSASIKNSSNSSTILPNDQDLSSINNHYDHTKKATLTFTSDYNKMLLDGKNVSYEGSNDINSYYDENNWLDVEAKGYVGEKVSLRNEKLRLNDLGYDTSNVPDEITFEKEHQEIKVNPFPYLEKFPSLNETLIKLVDIHDNLITTFIEPLENDPDKRYSKILQDVNSKGFGIGGDDVNYLSTDSTAGIYTVKVTAPTHQLTINYVDQNNNTVFSTKRIVDSYGHTDFYVDQLILNTNGISINPGQQYIPNYQNTATVYVTSSETHEDTIGSFDREIYYYLSNFYENPYDYGYPDPAISYTDGSPDDDNPKGDAFYAPITVLDKNGKTLFYGFVSSSLSNLVTTENFDSDFEDGDPEFNVSDVTDLPDTLDLTKGPFVFHSTEVYKSSNDDDQDDSDANQNSSSPNDGDQDNDDTNQNQSTQNDNSQNNNQTVPASQSNQSPAPASQQPDKSSAQPTPAPSPVSKPSPVVQTHQDAAPDSTATSAPASKPVDKTTLQPTNPVSKAKPSKTQLKAVAKSYKQSKHAVKSDTAKLRALKKKMKKRATKKQKKAYKSLQAKLSADKKAVKSYKNQEGKLTKYFKDVAIINNDNKKIKSLTSQMKKLKKSHSKASKKKYAKAAKALKKANSSLKTATKFVNNYK